MSLVDIWYYFYASSFFFRKIRASVCVCVYACVNTQEKQASGGSESSPSSSSFRLLWKESCCRCCFFLFIDNDNYWWTWFVISQTCCITVVIVVVVVVELNIEKGMIGVCWMDLFLMMNILNKYWITFMIKYSQFFFFFCFFRFSLHLKHWDKCFLSWYVYMCGCVCMFFHIQNFYEI